MRRSLVTGRRLLIATMALTIHLGALACQSHRTGGAPADSVPLVFSNESMDKADVWVTAVGQDARRIGVVLGGETATLQIPKRYHQSGRVNISTVLRGSPRTPWVEIQDLRTGAELRVRLPKDGRQLVAIR